MTSVSLVFKGGPTLGSPIHLVFGYDGDPPPMEDREVSIDAQFAPMTGSAVLTQGRAATADAQFPEMTGDAHWQYQSRTDRPLAHEIRTSFQQATHADQSFEMRYQQATRLPVARDVTWGQAAPLRESYDVRWQQAKRERQARDVRWQQAAALTKDPYEVRWQQGQAVRQVRDVRWQEALRMRLDPYSVRFQQGRRVRTHSEQSFQQGIFIETGIYTWFGHGRHTTFARDTRYQQARRPPIGRRVPPVVPPEDPCYLPPAGNAVELRFFDPWAENAHLVFRCETHGPGPNPGDTIIVPVRKVYIVINSSSLSRVDDGTPIECLGLSFKLDYQSWTWDFSAELPLRELDKVAPDMEGTPTAVQVMVNGQAYRMLVESRGRSRAFNQGAIAISGRGINAMLDAPNAPIMNFANTADRTAQQLLGDILSYSGVPLPDWTIDFQLEDYLIPAGTWTHQGTHISALNDVVTALGGYVQPHAWDKIMIAAHQYPTTPWHWADLTPDYELPVDVTTNEGIEWLQKARYNRVFVGGMKNGILGQVTRTGTAGDLVAPMAQHAVITNAIAARQRGRAIISDVGNQARVSLKLPVLPLTGIITPGKTVRYVDESEERVGYVRSVSVDVAMPEIFQTLVVETHVSP